MVVDAVPQEVNVLVVVPHARQFDSRHDLHPALLCRPLLPRRSRDAVVVAEGNGAQPDITRHGHEFCRRAESVGAGAVQVEVNGAVQVN